MKHPKINQSGAAIILFAMVMLIVLSLITIGFAFLVRNDQRQTLDKTLSNQAQYAAETAVNRKIKDLYNNVPPTLKTDCSAPPQITVPAGAPSVTITCLNWNTEPDRIFLSGLNINPKQALIQPKSGTVKYFAVLYHPSKPAGCAVSNSAPQFLNSLATAGSCPYLKITLSDAASVYSNKASVVYSRPQDNSRPTGLADTSHAENVGKDADYGGQVNGEASGEIDNTFCRGGWCIMRVSVPSGKSWTNATPGLTSFSVIGGEIDELQLAAYTDGPYDQIAAFAPAAPAALTLAPNNRVNLINMQAIVDATARAGDVIKRIQIAAPIGKNTWQPGFAVAADAICKNFSVDAINNDTAGKAVDNSGNALGACY